MLAELQYPAGVLEHGPSPYPGDPGSPQPGYTGGFGMDLMIKDLGLATEARAGSVVMAPQQLYQSMSFEGHGHLGFSAIIKRYRKESEW